MKLHDPHDPERDMQESRTLAGCLLIILALFIIWCALVCGAYQFTTRQT